MISPRTRKKRTKMEKLTKVIDALKDAKFIGVGCHTSPDGDALGSVQALTLALRKMGKDVYIFSKDKVMETLKFLPLSLEVEASDHIVKSGTDLIAMLDCGAIDRVNVDFKGIYGSQLLNIDHHKTNDRYGDINYVDKEASATGEIIFDIINKLGVEIDKDIATCLYTAITTDSGSFRFQCTTPRTHEIASALLKTGIDFSSISRTVFDTKPFGKVKLIGHVISSMESCLSGKVNILKVSESDFINFNVMDRDTSDIVNFGLAPMEAEVSILLKEAEDRIRVSMRTKEKVDAGKFSEKFKGGGHERAAGMTFMTPSTEEVKDTLLKELEAWLY